MYAIIGYLGIWLLLAIVVLAVGKSTSMEYLVMSAKPAAQRVASTCAAAVSMTIVADDEVVVGVCSSCCRDGGRGMWSSRTWIKQTSCTRRQPQ